LVARISAEAVKAMQAPEMAKRLIAEGSEAVTSSPQAFAAHLRDEQAQWRRVIKEANIRPQ
jgi:tripartite-type tricarboxylate transporter receptor subunit TctC